MMENGSSAGISSFEGTLKQFQSYLRKYENDDKLVIREAVERPGTKPGDNYTSMMIRTKVIGTRGNGSQYTRTFMTKKVVRGKNVSTLVDLSHFFRKEAYVYSEILPIVGSFGPRLLYADKETIIMEDLAERGYATCERRNCLDLDHTIFVLQKLAKFHASALALKINNPQQFDTLSLHLEETIYKNKSEIWEMWSYTEACIKSTVQYLDMIEQQTQELQTIRDHIATLSDKIYDSMYRLFTAPKQKYHTICHGDPWLNNFLFLHDNDGKIIDLKMVDYQAIRHSSVSSDILYFIYSSVQSSLIERSFESLIKIYHNEFLNELRQSRVDEKILKELGMEWLEKKLRTYILHGLLNGCIFVNPIFAEDEDIQQIEMMDFNAMKPQSNTTSAMHRKKLDRIKCIVFHYYRRFYLGIINEDIEPISVTG